MNTRTITYKQANITQFSAGYELKGLTYYVVEGLPYYECDTLAEAEAIIDGFLAQEGSHGNTEHTEEDTLAG